MQIKIIWPEVRFISENQIRIWYFDAVANGECDNDEPNDVIGMAEILQDIGHITLAAHREWR